MKPILGHLSLLLLCMLIIAFSLVPPHALGN